MKVRQLALAGLLLISFLLAPCGSSAKKKEADEKKIVVVLDPGHGGKDFGACENGAREKDINLAVAKKLRSLIDKELKDVEVVMTRSTDTYLTLQQRADVANKSGGDLFMSIHVNSVDKKSRHRKTVCGSSVYVLGLHRDGDNMKVAMRENSVIELESDYKEKYSGFDPSKDESYIIFEMAQKRNLGESIRVASDAQNFLVEDAGRANRGVRQAGFWVLWATSMPAVLVELDFICNPESVAFLTSDDGVERMAKSLLSSIKKFVERRS
ncbi:MAG: N-acetylmuramoyl-L-alanine amidase [Muribaculaceae bacterium]|nr:N-acetylmuramoyl-L-alanine amidase [Muribaculaceae bacterium]